MSICPICDEAQEYSSVLSDLEYEVYKAFSTVNSNIQPGANTGGELAGIWYVN